MKAKILLLQCLIVITCIPQWTHAAVTADYNGDQCIDQSDLAILRGSYANATTVADMDGSGAVDVKDLALLMKNWKACPGSFSIASLYPFAVGHALKYTAYNNNSKPTSTYEIITTDLWHEGHFTVHHQYGNVGSTAPFCPRVDDVYYFHDDQLFYTDTYDFYPPAPKDNNASTHTIYTPGHLWGRMTMFKNRAVSGTMKGQDFDIQNVDCTVTGAVARAGNPTHLTEAQISDSQSWSDYTGGAKVTVPTLLLQQKTFVNGQKNNIWLEQWQFYNDPRLGYMPIEITIATQSPKQTSPKVISHERLSTVQ